MSIGHTRFQNRLILSKVRHSLAFLLAKSKISGKKGAKFKGSVYSCIVSTSLESLDGHLKVWVGNSTCTMYTRVKFSRWVIKQTKRAEGTVGEECNCPHSLNGQQMNQGLNTLQCLIIVCLY